MTLATLQIPVAQPMRQQVVDILRDAITNCLFEPGGRLIERELCERFGVSRGTVREGMRQLEAEGLVCMVPNRGLMVTVLSRKEAADCYALRALLEGEASAVAARSVTKKVVATLGAHCEAMRAAFEDGDFIGLQQAKTAFYDLIFESVGNGQFERLLRQTRARNTLVRGLDIDRQRRMAESVRGATEIHQAIADGDAEAARQACVKHIQRVSRLALKAMEVAGLGDVG